VNPFYQGEFLNHFQQSFAETRNIIVGDLHSDVNALKRILEFTKFRSTDCLFALGDVIGRGNETIEILSFFMNTKNSLYILGNHEHLNLNLKFDYVSENDLLSFGGGGARLSSFKKGGKYFDFLSTRPSVLHLGDIILVHAGISLNLAQKYPKIEEINEKVMSEYEIFGPFGPLWYRAYAVRQEAAACPELTETLGILNSKFMIMGHSVSPQIYSRCKGKAIFVDTGISYAVNSNLSALEVIQIDGKTVLMTAKYPTYEEVVYESRIFSSS
jgi:Icc-related predicted phosphoesterase